MSPASLVFVALSVVYLVNAQSDEWNPTIRDKSSFCSKLARFAPTSDVYCEQFNFCCDSQFDPDNGDKCLFKEVTCNAIEGTNRAEGSCVYTNCTELITTTTTTTTTTAPPAINSAMGFIGSMVTLLPLVLIR